MPHAMHKVTTAGLMMLGLSLATLTSGCGVAEQAVQEAGEKIVEDQTGVDVDVNQQGNALPDTWPKEVPVVKGDISNSGSLSNEQGTTWTAQVKVSDANKGYDEAKQKLLDVGFTSTLESDLGGMMVGTFTSDAYDVSLTTISDGTGDFVAYLVTSKA